MKGDKNMKGFIIVAVCNGDCKTRLSNKAKAWFAALGSKQINKLKVM